MARDQLHEDRNRSLVVGAEDRLAGAAEDPVGFDHLDLAPVRNGVDVGAEHHPAIALARQPRDDVARPRFRRPGGIVLAHLEAERAQLGDDRVRHLALLAGRAADLAEPNKRLVKPLHGGDRLIGARAQPTGDADSLPRRSLDDSSSSAGRSPAWRAAAPTNSRKSGSGRLGRELNSGWNWEATKKG